MTIGTPPINEPAGEAWRPAWANWFTQVVKALRGFRETYTTTILHDFGSISAGSQASTTVALPGVLAGDVAVCQGILTDGVIYQAYVTATDTVTVRASNYSTGPVDPASQTLRVIVFRQ